MEPIAFLSYAHLDDAGSVSEISLFHDKLQNELRIHTGIRSHIFFDKKHVEWGKRWQNFINNGLDSSVFLIPILTPSFFRSTACREEYTRFKEVEKTIGRTDLILPIYYVKCREIYHREKQDDVVDDILSRQYRDWRHLRHRPADSTELLTAFSDIAAFMAETFFDIREKVESRETKHHKTDNFPDEYTGYRDKLLSKEITYDNVISYSVDEYPHLPVSRDWTKKLISDIDRSSYHTIRDIDVEVKYAKRNVDEYANENPDLFKYSTDFITKSLLFVDSRFRAAHPISPRTLAAAKKAGITKY